MKVTDSTKAVAQSINDYFLVYPERHDQRHWVTVDGDETVSNISDENVCNTTMCIAGSAVFLTRSLAEFRQFSYTGDSWQSTGADLLGLDYDEADWLFYDTKNETAIDAVRAIANGDADKFADLMSNG